MEGRLLIKDCALWGPLGFSAGMAVSAEAGVVRQVEDDAALPVRPGDWEVRAQGRWLSTGSVDAGLLVGPLSLAQGRGLSGERLQVLVESALAQAARRGITTALERWPGRDMSLWPALLRAVDKVGLRLFFHGEEPANISSHPLVTWGMRTTKQPGEWLQPVKAGCLADFTLYDWIPPMAPLPKEELERERKNAPVGWTVVAGRVVVREGQLLSVDGLALAKEAAKVLKDRGGP